jgi:hypothetical protein
MLGLLTVIFIATHKNIPIMLLEYYIYCFYFPVCFPDIMLVFHSKILVLNVWEAVKDSVGGDFLDQSQFCNIKQLVISIANVNANISKVNMRHLPNSEL